MPFITQGKTNWKFLLIVIILAVVVGGMTLLYFRFPPEPLPNQIDILVDGKTEKLVGITLPISREEAINIVKEFCEPKYTAYQYDYEGIEKVNNEWQIMIPNINCVCAATVNEVTGETKYQVSVLSTNETADWKTYKNEKHGYEVKHPKEWVVETEDISDGLQQTNITRFYISEEETKPTLVIHIYKSQDFSLNNWIDFYTSYTGNRVINRETILIPAPETNIEGIKGDHMAGDQLYKGVFLLRVDKIYNLDLIPRKYREFTDEELGTFNQVLSTFKFIELEGVNYPLIQDKETCLAQGGGWVTVPGLYQGPQPYRCDIRTKDGGEICTSDNECEGLCRVIYFDPPKTNEEGFITGQCSLYKYWTDMIDCPSHLPASTKDIHKVKTDYCI